MMNFKVFVTIFLIVLLVGCGGVANKKRATVLDDAIDQYVLALRWSRIDDAIAYHVDRGGEKMDVDLTQMESIRVTGYHIREKIINDEFNEATVNGELNYYHNEYGTLKKLPLEQKWWFDEAAGKWYLESGFPEF